MLCKNCGQEIPETASVCLYCGVHYTGTQLTAEEVAVTGQLKCTHCGYIGDPIIESILRPLDWVIGILFFPIGMFYLVFTEIRRKKFSKPHCPICKQSFTEEELNRAGYVIEKKKRKKATQIKQTAESLAKSKEFRRDLHGLWKSLKNLGDSFNI